MGFSSSPKPMPKKEDFYLRLSRRVKHSEHGAWFPSSEDQMGPWLWGPPKALKSSRSLLRPSNFLEPWILTISKQKVSRSQYIREMTQSSFYVLAGNRLDAAGQRLSLRTTDLEKVHPVEPHHLTTTHHIWCYISLAPHYSPARQMHCHYGLRSNLRPRDV
jgi:hypothetical protein